MYVESYFCHLRLGGGKPYLNMFSLPKVGWDFFQLKFSVRKVYWVLRRGYEQSANAKSYFLASVCLCK